MDMYTYTYIHVYVFFTNTWTYMHICINTCIYFICSKNIVLFRFADFFAEISPKRNEIWPWQNETEKVYFGETISEFEPLASYSAGSHTPGKKFFNLNIFANWKPSSKTFREGHKWGWKMETTTQGKKSRATVSEQNKTLTEMLKIWFLNYYSWINLS
jgi:hypothetical protein